MDIGPFLDRTLFRRGWQTLEKLPIRIDKQFKATFTTEQIKIRAMQTLVAGCNDVIGDFFVDNAARDTITSVPFCYGDYILSPELKEEVKNGPFVDRRTTFAEEDIIGWKLKSNEIAKFEDYNYEIDVKLKEYYDEIVVDLKMWTDIHPLTIYEVTGATSIRTKHL